MKNKYIGKWEESGWKEIKLPFTSENLKLLLEKVLTTSEYTSQDIARWCDLYIMEKEKSDRGYVIAEDISVQWDLFLTNTYSLEELKALDFSKVRFPAEWFTNSTPASFGSM